MAENAGDTMKHGWEFQEEGGQKGTSRFERMVNWFTGWGQDIETHIGEKEVRALIRYATENGIDPKVDGTASKPEIDEIENSTIVQLNNALHELEIANATKYKVGTEYLEAIKAIESRLFFHYSMEPFILLMRIK